MAEGISISLAADIRAFQRGLDDAALRQLPFATALALTATAKAAQVEVTRQLPTIFDKPTPFTMKAIAIKPARKTDPVAQVYVRPAQAEYLGIQETGGTRLPKKRALVLPGAIPLNSFGNIPKGAIKRALGRKQVFSGVVRGVAGIFQRASGRQVARGASPLRLLAAYQPAAQYKPVFGFVGRVEAAARAAIGPALQAAMAKAMASRRGP